MAPFRLTCLGPPVLYGPDGDPIRFVDVLNPTHGTIGYDVHGNIVFTPDADFSGVASFEASLDGAAHAPATSPATFAGLAEGAHTFAVRAIDAAGNMDATPATYTWTIDPTAPAPPASSLR